jgi:hypothetical protein
MFNQLKPIALIFTAFCCLMSCQSIGKKSQITIQTKTLDTQILMHNDKFGDQKMNWLRRDSTLKETDHFPKFYTFMVKNRIQAMYVRPKNKHVTIIDQADSLAFEGLTYPDEAVIMCELNRRFSAFQGYTLGLWKRSYDLKDAYLSSKKIYEEEQAYLKQAFKQFKTGRDFRKALLREIKYSYICNLIGPYSVKEVNVDSISQDYVKTVLGLKKDLNAIIKTRRGTDKNVQLVVYDYSRFLSRKTMKTETAFDHQWQSAEQNFKGETQEYLKFRILKENYGAISNYDAYFEKFKTSCKDKDFTTYLTDFAAHNTHDFNAAELGTTLSDSTGKTMSWADILAENKGKKIYLMASGLSSFAFQGEALAKKITDFEKNNVKVIFISSERRKEKWLNELKTDDAKLFQHYHTSATDAPLLAFVNKKKEMESRFSNILIDENGKVVLCNAAYPSKFDLLLRQLRTMSKVLIP